MPPSVAGEVTTIAQTRAFYEALARSCDADVEQIELALADLAALELDEATLDGFQSAQEDARRAASRCRSAIAVLNARQAVLEEAVNATPDAAKTEFYRDGTATARARRTDQPAANEQENLAMDDTKRECKTERCPYRAGHSGDCVPAEFGWDVDPQMTLENQAHFSRALDSGRWIAWSELPHMYSLAGDEAWTHIGKDHGLDPEQARQAVLAYARWLTAVAAGASRPTS